MRKVVFANGEYYHIFNRGVDKRTIFEDDNDMKRFFQSMNEFNTIDPIGGIYQNSFLKNKEQLRSLASKKKLVSFVCYCLNPNHYHFILRQLSDKGIEKFMHKIGTGYTKYFNEKYERSGSLFQGTYKAVHVNSNEQLLHLSAYVSLNYKIHNLKKMMTRSSWDEYISDGLIRKRNFCDKEDILAQFRNIKDYKEFMVNSLKGIKERKEANKSTFLE